MTTCTFDPHIQLSFGGVRGVTVELVNGRNEPVGELHLFNQYQLARDGWFEALKTLAAAHDVNEQLAEKIAQLEAEVERLRDLDDYDHTIAERLRDDLNKRYPQIRHDIKKVKA